MILSALNHLGIIQKRLSQKRKIVKIDDGGRGGRKNGEITLYSSQ